MVRGIFSWIFDSAYVHWTCYKFICIWLRARRDFAWIKDVCYKLKFSRNFDAAYVRSKRCACKSKMLRQFLGFVTNVASVLQMFSRGAANIGLQCLISFLLFLGNAATLFPWF
jgi:hypothetical protein